MNDIFQQVRAGNAASIKGLYSSSVESAYAAVFAATGDETAAVEMVKEIYVWAFTGADSYEAFFSLLNARAAKAVKVLVDKNATLGEITATASIFADVNALEIPAALKEYPDALCSIVLRNLEQAKQKPKKAIKNPLKKAKKEKPKTELQEFDELVKKHEFSMGDVYKAPEPEKAEKPKTLAEKLQPEEVQSDEKEIRRRLEMEKNKRLSVIALIFATIILAGAAATYVITSRTELFRPAQTTAGGTQVNTTAISPYGEGEQRQAFEDYFRETILKETPLVSTERIIAYDETDAVGLDQLIGTISAKVLDIDGDKTEEMIVVRSDIIPGGNTYQFRFLLDLYRFEDFRVKPVCKGYSLVDYTLYNSGLNDDFANFKIVVRLDETASPKRLSVAAYSRQMRVYAFHYFANGAIRQADRLSYIAPEENVQLYLQKSMDGTDLPLFLEVYGKVQNSVDIMDEESLLTVQDYAFTFGARGVKYTSFGKMIKDLNARAAKFGFRFSQGLSAKTTLSSDTVLCKLVARKEQGDMLSHQEVVAFRDYSGLMDQKQLPLPTETTTKPTETTTKSTEDTTKPTESQTKNGVTQ